MKNYDYKIDFIIPWVNSSDPNWIESFNKYSQNKSEKIDLSEIRYRDNGLLKYWFRGVENFAPWVNKIHFITNGQKPEWLNINHEKLHFVKHSDYIPNELLPVFSSHPIELFIHKIEGLSEHFVYFNDDFFLTNHVKPNYFFKKGLPCDSAIVDIKTGFNLPMTGIVLNNLEQINSNFSMKKVIQKNLFKWINLSYKKGCIKNISLMFWKNFPGFINTHSAQPYIKSNINDCWNFCYEKINETVKNRFRSYDDVNQWLFKHWALCKGHFTPVNPYKDKKNYDLRDTNIEQIASDIKNQKYKEIIINDSEVQDFESLMNILKESFDYILPKKSSFEI